MELLKKFKDLQFFTGESMNPDGMVVIGDYKDIDGEERPVLYFPKYGLQEEKLWANIIIYRYNCEYKLGWFVVTWVCLASVLDSV